MQFLSHHPGPTAHAPLLLVDCELSCKIHVAGLFVLSAASSVPDPRLPSHRPRLVNLFSYQRPNDVFIVSYPKSGNFWMRFLLAHTWLYSQRGESNWHREIDFNSIERTIPDLEYGPNRREYYQHDKFRAFKSHQPFAPKAVAGKCADTVGSMEDYQCACPNCPPQWHRILHLVRDGRDAMCSYYHFRLGLGNLEPRNMGFEDFLKADIYPGFGWAGHVNSYLDLKGNSSYDVMTVKYEDLHRAPLETMTEVGTVLMLQRPNLLR